MEGYSVGITQAPSDHLQVGAIWVASKDGAAGLGIAMDNLSGHCGGAVWDKGARHGSVQETAKNIFGFVVSTSKHYVFRRHIMLTGEIGQPLIREVVWSYHAVVGDAAN